MNKILSMYIKEKVEGTKYVDSTRTPFQLLKEAERLQKLNSIKSDMYACAFKTKISMSNGDQKNGVIMTFTIKLPDTSVSSSSITQTIMGIIQTLDTILHPIFDYTFIKSVEGMNKNIAIIQIYKIDSDEIEFTL